MQPCDFVLVLVAKQLEVALRDGFGKFIAAAISIVDPLYEIDVYRSDKCLILVVDEKNLRGFE